jgi:5'(3')-deoxyribonucleotidase
MYPSGSISIESTQTNYDAVPKANYPFDILIDDAPKNLIDIISPKSAILFNQPWNKNFSWPVRVNSLSEAEKLL